MANMTSKVAALSAALAALSSIPASGADLLIRQPPRIAAPAPLAPRVVQRADECVYVLAQVRGYSGQPIFRVTLVGRDAMERITFPVALQGDRLCLSRKQFLKAHLVEICLGSGPRSSRIIQNQWMATARQNLQSGNVVNPGQPMVWRYEGPVRAYGHRHGASRPLMTGAALLGTGIMVGRAMRR